MERNLEGAQAPQKTLEDLIDALESAFVSVTDARLSDYCPSLPEFEAEWKEARADLLSRFTTLSASLDATRALLGQAMEHTGPCYCNRKIGYRCPICDIRKEFSDLTPKPEAG